MIWKKVIGDLEESSEHTKYRKTERRDIGPIKEDWIEDEILNRKVNIVYTNKVDDT